MCIQLDYKENEETEFCHKRIKEQLAYIDEISLNTSMSAERKTLILTSANGQLQYFRDRLKAEIGNQQTLNFVGNTINKKQKYG